MDEWIDGWMNGWMKAINGSARKLLLVSNRSGIAVISSKQLNKQ
jgi:hypothetical protein